MLKAILLVFKLQGIKILIRKYQIKKKNKWIVLYLDHVYSNNSASKWSEKKSQIGV